MNDKGLKLILLNDHPIEECRYTYVLPKQGTIYRIKNERLRESGHGFFLQNINLQDNHLDHINKMAEPEIESFLIKSKEEVLPIILPSLSIFMITVETYKK